MCKNMQNKYGIFFISSKYNRLLSHLAIVWIYKKNIYIIIYTKCMDGMYYPIDKIQFEFNLLSS